MLDTIKNEKHKLMIQLMYSAGLRVSEVINLKVRDFNIENNLHFNKNKSKICSLIRTLSRIRSLKLLSSLIKIILFLAIKNRFIIV
jgi:site-specific recombinase XerD